MHQRLRQSILEASKRGFVAGTLEQQLAHTEEFVSVVAERCPAAAHGIDLGSGGGLPALGLLLGIETLHLWLVEAQRKRAEFLMAEVSRLGLGGRALVRHARAESLADEPGVARGFDLVTARGFARPGTTAEIASHFLREAGVLVVSEPPGSEGSRWDAGALDLLGLSLEEIAGVTFRFAVIRRSGEAAPGYPRGGAKPFKRPLF